MALLADPFQEFPREQQSAESFCGFKYFDDRYAEPE